MAWQQTDPSRAGLINMASTSGSTSEDSIQARPPLLDRVAAEANGSPSALVVPTANPAPAAPPEPLSPSTHPLPSSEGSPGVESDESQVQELVAIAKGRRLWVALAGILVVVVIAATGASFLASSGSRQSTNDAYVEGRIVRISPKISGQVVALRVDDNDHVMAGDVLLEIDPADYQAKLDQ